MNTYLNTKNLVAIALILFGALLAVSQNIKPVNNEIAILNIEKPTQEVIEIVKPIADLISDPTDRAKLAIFNQDFANRIIGYETDNQKTNDVYVLAASIFFKDDLRDKYRDLDSSLVKLLESSIGSDNHVLNKDEKLDIHNKFMGLAWALTQKK